MKKIVLFSIILSTIASQLTAQTINLSPNVICFDKEVPAQDNITIDPYNLPVSCMEYDEVGSLNLDLVFEDEFNGPSVDLEKWIGASPQRGKLFNVNE